MEPIQLNEEEIEALLQRVEAVLQEEDYAVIKSMIDAIIRLNQALNQKAASIKRLLSMLFGSKTEKKKNVLKKKMIKKKNHLGPPPKRRERDMEKGHPLNTPALREKPYPIKNTTTKILAPYVLTAFCTRLKSPASPFKSTAAPL